MTEYSMEQLLPIVGELAHKRVSGESTSVTYETANQLMEAVLYTMRMADAKNTLQIVGQPEARDKTQEETAIRAIYETGKKQLKRKVQKTMVLYQTIAPEFCGYQNRCLMDTFLKGIPAFFKHYDMEFAPQDTILTLDYPILKTLEPLSGVNAIFEYLKCIRYEQIFLSFVGEAYVMKALREYSPEYTDMVENLVEIVWSDIVNRTTGAAHETFINQMADAFSKKLPNEQQRIAEYLKLASRNIACRAQLNNCK